MSDEMSDCRYCKNRVNGEPCDKINFTRRDVRACEYYEDVKKLYFKLPPELSDGQHWVPTDDINVVLDFVKEWCKESKEWVGESFTIEVIEMSDAEIEALPDI